MTSKFIIVRESEESFVVSLNGKHVISANHDDHGWDGMSAIEQTIFKISKI